LASAMSGGTRMRGQTPSSGYRAYVLALLIAVGVVGWVDRNVFAALLQAIKLELLLSDTQLGLLGGVAFGVFYATIGLPVAWLADRYERRTLIAAALGLWSLMTALCGAASSFASLFLFRIGVGIGEAGGSPPSQSLLSDFVPPERRARALGIFYLYIPCGFVVGYLCGGWLSDLVGWRLTFAIVGLPGVILAVLLRLTLHEPSRGSFDASEDSGSTPSLAATIRFFLSNAALRQLPLAGAVHGVGAFAAALWLPAYFMRTFDVTSTTAGWWMAIAYGCGGTLGTLSGGLITDFLVEKTRDARWYPWSAAAAALATLPCTLLLYLTHQPVLAVSSLVVSTFFGHMFLGPVAALLQNLAGARRRATAAAFYLFLVNLVSMGLGPVAVGAASDYLSELYGNDALRYSLLAIVGITTMLAAVHFFLASRALSPADALGRTPPAGTAIHAPP
jgi:predicted MFS family arabinose efflux permease